MLRLWKVWSPFLETERTATRRLQVAPAEVGAGDGPKGEVSPRLDSERLVVVSGCHSVVRRSPLCHRLVENEISSYLLLSLCMYTFRVVLHLYTLSNFKEMPVATEAKGGTLNPTSPAAHPTRRADVHPR